MWSASVSVTGSFDALSALFFHDDGFQVRRGSEPSLNQVEPSEDNQAKRWSAAGLLNRDPNIKSSKNDLSVINEASFYGNGNFDFDPGGNRLSPLPPPFERGQGSGAARDSDRPNPFATEQTTTDSPTRRMLDTTSGSFLFFVSICFYCLNVFPR